MPMFRENVTYCRCCLQMHEFDMLLHRVFPVPPQTHAISCVLWAKNGHPLHCHSNVFTYSGLGGSMFVITYKIDAFCAYMLDLSVTDSFDFTNDMWDQRVVALSLSKKFRSVGNMMSGLVPVAPTDALRLVAPGGAHCIVQRKREHTTPKTAPTGAPDAGYYSGLCVIMGLMPYLGHLT